MFIFFNFFFYIFYVRTLIVARLIHSPVYDLLSLNFSVGNLLFIQKKKFSLCLQYF